MSSVFKTIQRTGIVLICLGFMAFPGSVLAQSYDNPGLGEQPILTHPQDFKPLGIRAGGFMLHPGVQLTAEHSDNALYTAEDTVSDWIWHLRPYITAQSNWNRHSLNVRLAADIARYQDNGFQDYEDYFFLVNGRLDVRNRSYLSYSLDYMNLHEGRNNRTAEQGIEPTRYDLYGGSLGYDHTFNRLHIGVSGKYSRLDFDDSVSANDDIIDNQDRDRDTMSFGMRAGYQFQTDKQAFVSATYYKVNYDEEFDRNGLARSADGYTLSGGLTFTLTGVLAGDLFVSYHDQSFDDPALVGVSGWGAGAGLQWLPTRLTAVRAQITSGIEATTYEYSSGYFRTLYSVRVDHELTRDLQLTGQVSYSDNDYQLLPGAPLDARSGDKLFSAGVGVNYFFNRYISMSAAYDYQKLSSNVPADEYRTNRVWLSLTLER
ncbi:MAG: outer membrane beta-barrel protein [Xanthomonadales bacterium]|nr:outer membrane beta-barrel protein [Xanthomonadales bacterium]